MHLFSLEHVFRVLVVQAFRGAVAVRSDVALRGLLGCALAFAILVAPAGLAAGFRTANPMGIARSGHTATLMGDDLTVDAVFDGVSFEQDSVCVTESGGDVSLTVLGVHQAAPYAVTVYIVPASAMWHDFAVPAADSLTLFWNDGDDGGKKVKVHPKSDGLPEGEEIFYAVLGSPSNCIVGTAGVCAVKILDDDGTAPDKGVFVAGIARPPEGGTVWGGAYCRPGKAVRLVASPKPGWTFLRWDDGSQASELTVGAGAAVPDTPEGTVFRTALFKPVADVEPPQVQNPGPQRAMVGVAFEMSLLVESESLPKANVTGLPPGLTYDSRSLRIAGVPTKAGTYAVTLTASNPGGAAVPQAFTVSVEPLQPWAQGAFDGFSTDAYANGQGIAKLSVTPLGRITGSLDFGGTTHRFGAPCWKDPGFGFGLLSAMTTVRAGVRTLALSIVVQPRSAIYDGNLGDDGQERLIHLIVAEPLEDGTYRVLYIGWLYRNVWKDADMVTVLTNNFTGYYTAAMPGGSEYGSGYLTFTVDRRGGVKTAGKLADGTAVSMGGPLIRDDTGRLWTVLNALPKLYSGGRFFGVAEFFKTSESGRVVLRLLGGKPLLWESLSPTATGVYGAGFDRELGLTGGWYDTLGNLYRYYAGKVLAVGTEGAPVPELLVGTNRYDSIWWDPDGLSLRAVTNSAGVMTGLAGPKAGLPVKVGNSNVYDYATGTNAVGLTVALTRATGVFKGAFKAWFDYGTTHTYRNVAYEGALTPEREDAGDGIAGRGFFLWADKGQYLNPYNRMTPYSFNWSYDLKILLPAEMVLVQGGSLPDIGNGAINVDSFYIGKCEVTWAEWQTVREWAVTNDYAIGYGESSEANHPVHSVSWYDCVKWCNARSEKEGRTPVYYTDAGCTLIYKANEVMEPFVNATATGYRLPTDAEWEFAARGGTQSLGYEYSGGNDLNAVGWYVDNSDGEKTVGTKAANELGLYDMSGNVWEWCFDWYPGKEGSNRVIRGGSCYHFANYCRSAHRDSFLPYYRQFFIFGFRAARTLP